jgi:hypothetical protein
MFWALKQEGWSPKKVGNKEIAGALGTAFHLAAAAHNRGERNLEVLQVISQTEYTRIINEISRGLDDEGLGKAEVARQTLEKCVSVYVKDDPVNEVFHKVEDVEFTLDNYGGTTIDLGVRLYDGTLGVLDYKCKRFSNPYYKYAYLEEFERLWQMKHYVWAYAQHKGEPVSHFYLGLMEIRQRPQFELHVYDVDVEALKIWEQSAIQTWNDMYEVEQGTRVPYQVANCRSQYGNCEFLRLCHTYKYDEQASQVEYNVPRRESHD